MPEHASDSPETGGGNGIFNRTAPKGYHMRTWTAAGLGTLLIGMTALGVMRPAAAEEPLGLSGARQLFVDEHLVASMENCRLVVHPGRPETDEPLERGIGRGSVVRLPDGTYEAFYGGRSGVYIATSPDGLEWTTEWADEAGELESRRVMPPYLGRGFIGSPAAFYDARTPDPEERYKMGVWQFGGLCVAFSPDGRDWRMHPRVPADPWTRDVIAPTWDPVNDRFLIPCQVNVRGWDYAGRAIGISWSRDFRHWQPVGVVLRPDERDPVGMQLHGMAATWYESVFLGFVQMFHTQPAMVQQMAEGGEIAYQHIELATSRDGIDWRRSPERVPLIPLGSYEKNAWYAGRISTASTVIEQEDEVVVLISGGSWPQLSRHAHQNELYEGMTNHPLAVQDFLWQIPRMGGSSRVRFRLDGFVSVRADEGAEAVLVTKPFLAAGDALVVNADAEGGRVVVEILDEDYRPLADLPPSAPLTGDGVRQVVSFGGGTEVLSALAGRTLRLRFRMENADLYAFALRGAPRPAIVPGVPQETLETLPPVGTEPDARAALGRAQALLAEGRSYDAKRIGRAVLAEEGLDGWASVRAPLVELLFFGLRLDEEVLPRAETWLERDDLAPAERELVRYASYVRTRDLQKASDAQALATELLEAETLLPARRVEVWTTYVRNHGRIKRRLRETAAKEKETAADAADDEETAAALRAEAERIRESRTTFEEALADTRAFFQVGLRCTDWEAFRPEWAAQLLRDHVLADGDYEAYRPAAIWHWASLWGALKARKSVEWVLTRTCDALIRSGHADLVPAYRNYYRGLSDENPLAGVVPPLPEEWLAPLGELLPEADGSWEGRMMRARTLFAMGRYREAGRMFLALYREAPSDGTGLREEAYGHLVGCVFGVEMRPGLALELARAVQYDRTPLPGQLLDASRILGGEQPPLPELRERVLRRPEP